MDRIGLSLAAVGQAAGAPFPAPVRRALIILGLLFVAAALIPASLVIPPELYLPLHSSMEVFAVVVAGLVFALGWNAGGKNAQRESQFVACAFLAVGLLDLGHLLSFQGMPQFVTPSDPEKAIAFWLTGRLTDALALLVAALTAQRIVHLPGRWVALATSLGLTATIFWVVLFHPEVLPRTFVAGQGLTGFKIASEYLVIGIHLLTIALLWRQLGTRPRFDVPGLLGAAAAFVLAELFFTLYATVTDLHNFLGHVFKVAAYAFVYRAVFVDCVRRPYLELIAAEERERRAMVVALEASEAKFRAMADTVPCVIYMRSDDGLLEFLNRRGWDDTDVQPTQSSVNWQDLIHPDDLAQTLRSVEVARAKGGVNSVEFRLRGPTGSYRWFAAASRPINDGPRVKWLGAAIDIDRLKQQEAALRWNEQRNALLSHIAARLLQTRDPRGVIGADCSAVMRFLGCDVFFNYLVHPHQQRLQLYAAAGISAEQRADFEWLDYGDAACGSVALQGRRGLWEGVQGNMDERLGMVRALGVRAYACFPLLAPAECLGTLGFGTRERDRFSAEELDMMQAATDLVAAALKREQIEQALHDADRHKDRFLAILAHELRNPLGTLTLVAEAMKTGKGNPERLQGASDIMERQLVHLTGLVDELLDLSRIRSGKLELRTRQIELGEVLRAAAESAARWMRAFNHRFTLVASDRPLYLQGDFTRLSQVFANLLTNAAKYTERGGQVWLHAEQDGASAVVRVRDTGIGIAQDKLDSIFSMFCQLKRGGSSSEGLGIGLHLARRLVDLHGGTITASSAGEGQGSEFVVRLPLCSTTAGAAQA